ncbi:hypothetical protein [Pseudoxanthomonas sp. CF125]|uniref:hypothetical protein n=1 Tax=Pseudoxanthomonas sp. CF125 TaxID=1855303 RepID=UPI00088CFB7B|nr:hypothetical protein [Pseudoxanthomonas sp. CF125]SDQ22497.1 hypothetical protein SAMN05216569_0174 [Pseudoxanthomonas sp. CF125]
MKSYSPEPLTPEERELARLTGHLGPQGEPSTALDARILAAAHAALERKQPVRRKPRWPVAMGLAASVVFAVGIAWQLRPLQQTPMAATEVPADEAVATQVLAVQAPAPSREGPAAASAAADLASAGAPAEPMPTEQAPPAPAKVLAPSPAEFHVPPPRQPIARAKTRTSDTGRQARGAGTTATAAVPPPPAPPAPVAMAPAASTAEAQAPMAFAPEPQERESDHFGYSARAIDNSASSAGVMSAKPQADAMAESKSTRAAASARQKESASLDRIEVTGSRMKRTDLQVPVSDDAQLPVNEWLERVRTRYGLGDAGAAKQSLLLFVKDHPSEPVPGDLEPLLEE